MLTALSQNAATVSNTSHHPGEIRPRAPHSEPTLGLDTEDHQEPPTMDVLALAAKFNFVIQDAVLTNLEARTKGEAIAAMVSALATHGAIADVALASVTTAVLRREELGSTGVGRGIAIPHAKHPAIDRVVANLAWVPDGLEFDSLDGRPVHLLCLLLSPPERHREQLLALQSLAREFLQLARGG